MSSDLVMTADIGTTNVKVALFDLNGNKVFHFERKCAEDIFNGRHEIDPEKWWVAFALGVNSIDEKIKKRVRAICISGQGPTIVLVDQQGKLVHKAVSWLDNRGAEHVRSLKAEGLDEQTASTIAKLLELKKIVSGRVYLLQPSDYLILRLTGLLVNATFHQLGYSPWYREVLEKFELDDYFMIPDIVEPPRLVGRIQKKIASHFRLPEETFVVAGAPDFAAALIGTGTLKPGIVCDRAGTSEGVTLCSDIKIDTPGLITTPFFMNDFWKVSGVLTSSGKAIEWVTRCVTRFRSIDGLSLSRVSRPTGVIFLPHLAGERSPYWNMNLKGVFFGLRLDTNAKNLVVSVAEGVAFAVRQIIEEMKKAGAKILTVRTTGGQATNDLWNQIKADVLGMSVEVVQPDAELLGCAILAISCLTGESFAQIAQKLTKVKKYFTPDTERSSQYDKLYQVYLELHERNMDLFNKLG